MEVLAYHQIFSIFAAISIAHYGLEGQILLEKGRLRTLSSTVESRKFSLRRERNENVHVGRIVPSIQPAIDLMAGKCALQYFTAWAIELLILRRGNARAIPWDRRVEHPRLSFKPILTAESGWL